MKTISLNDSWLFRKLPGYTLGNVSDLSPEAFPAQTVSLPPYLVYRRRAVQGPVRL